MNTYILKHYDFGIFYMKHSGRLIPCCVMEILIAFLYM